LDNEIIKQNESGMMGNMMTGGVMGSRHNKNKMK